MLDTIQDTVTFSCLVQKVHLILFSLIDGSETGDSEYWESLAGQLGDKESYNSITVESDSVIHAKSQWYSMRLRNVNWLYFKIIKFEQSNYEKTIIFFWD